MKSHRVCTELLLFPGLYATLSGLTGHQDRKAGEEELYESRVQSSARISHELVACTYASTLRFGLPSKLTIWPSQHDVLSPFICFPDFSFLLLLRHAP